MSNVASFSETASASGVITFTDSPISGAGNCCGILNGIQIEGVFPIPEPSSVVALGGLCAAGLVVAARRRFREAG
jgi:hypothetical protein